MIPKQNRILLVYPEMGLSGVYVRHLPLSLLYTAIDSIKAGFAIDIVDTRLSARDWQKEIAARITPETILAGVSVITGTAVCSALEITRWLKEQYPALATVWGGPHASFNPTDILSESAVDYVICGYGSRPLARLACRLRGDSGGLSPAQIPGLSSRNPDNGTIVSVAPESAFERVDFREIPYHLVEDKLRLYSHLDGNDRVFSIYGTLGCPYQCSFCSSPELYRSFGTRYELIPPREVVDHIESLVQRYDASYIYFIDDDSFVDLNHVEAIIDGIAARGLSVRLGFRGARVDEVLRMSDAYLTKLARAGTDILHIGAESGSQRMLDLMRKNVTVNEILEANRKLARHPEIKAGYNLIAGIPGETVAELAETRQMVMQILDENPEAIIFPLNKYRPLPGTELYDAAVRHGYAPPLTQDEWGEVEVDGDFTPPWYSVEFAAAIRMMQVTTYFIDRKFFTLSSGNRLYDLLLKLVSTLYRPLARLRYRHGLTGYLVEYWCYIRFARSFRR